jgi:uncharacterized protein (DUF433 family)
MGGWRERLARGPRVRGGRICARGTRVPAANILDSLTEGAPREEIPDRYPSPAPERIEAAMAYAAELARDLRVLGREADTVAEGGLRGGDRRGAPGAGLVGKRNCALWSGQTRRSHGAPRRMCSSQSLKFGTEG